MNPDRSWRLAVVAAVLLWLSTPPARLPAGEFLVLPGLMLFYAIASGQGRAVAACYLLGLLHMAAFSFSVRHVLFVAWIAIAVLGGFYYAAAAVATRKFARWLKPWAFGIALAGSCWLRAEMPEICYPHGQPGHALWQWPLLLGSVALGGEPLLHLLLGTFAAALVDLGRSWRVAIPAWPPAWRQLIAVAVVGIALTWLGQRPTPGGERQRLQVLAIEPGLHPMDPYADTRTREEYERRFYELFAERLLEPTRREVATMAPPPDLVLWPESSLYHHIEFDGAGRPRFEALHGLQLPAASHLLVGAGVLPVGATQKTESTPAAVLVDGSGRYVGHHEKQRLVPGGEFLPLVGWLPDVVTGWIHAAFEAALGSAPDCRPGRALPPLRVGGVTFTGLLCYDNAFPGPALTAVRNGARLLVVLSNEGWYRNGAELDQLLAMTVFRALETATPIVRCTTDGMTAAVDADGRVLGGLPKDLTPTATARAFSISMPVRDEGVPAVAWSGPWLGATAGTLVLLAILHAASVWARLAGLRPRPSPDRSSPPGA
ncbi:MAG: apolipoprotein N-acyltransferase [Planctomycetes bacterium]|nr:apolipoprotein N-acyltransferase [Planctomycetota bacterium]